MGRRWRKIREIGTRALGISGQPYTPAKPYIPPKETTAEELKEYLGTIKGKDANRTVATIMIDRASDEYRDFKLAEIKQFVSIVQKCDGIAATTELMRSGTRLMKACVEEWQLTNMMDLAHKIAKVDLRSGIAFLRKSIELIREDRSLDLNEWVSLGLNVPDKERFSYFNGEHPLSQKSLGLTKKRTVFLVNVSGSFRCFTRAISGKPMDIQPTNETPNTDGKTIFLPPKEEEFPTRELNRRKLRVLAAHEARHAKDSFIIDMSKVNTDALAEIGKSEGSVRDTLHKLLKDYAKEHERPLLDLVLSMAKLQKDELNDKKLERLLQVAGYTESDIRKALKEDSDIFKRADYLQRALASLGIPVEVKKCSDHVHFVIDRDKLDEVLPDRFYSEVTWDGRVAEEE